MSSHRNFADGNEDRTKLLAPRRSSSDSSGEEQVSHTPLRNAPSPLPLAPSGENENENAGETTTKPPQRSVRFQIDDSAAAEAGRPSTDTHEDEDHRWTYDEDFLESSDDEFGAVGRAPLLTNVAAPSVLLAEGIDVGVLGEADGVRPKSSSGMAFMNMANSIIGAGIIGQPYAFKQAGLITGVILLVALTVTVDWTINLIVINSKLSGADSFQATVKACFGRPGLISISLAQWAFAFGGMIAFCIIIGDTIPHVMAALFPSLKDMPILWLLTNRNAVIIACTAAISFPLSLYRDISKLAKASALALVSMMIIVVTVLTQGFRIPSELRGHLSLSLLTINSGIFQAIGVISFAFVCHHNSLLIYGSLRKPTLDRFAKVTHYSTGISMIACLTMALAGFLTFGDKTKGNVLNNFPSSNFMVNIARFCFGLNMMTTLPLEAFVCREVMENYWYPGAPHNQTRHIIFTTGLVFSSMSFSLLTCDLGAVFEIIGATSACALAYILPPLCFIKLSTRSWKTLAAMGCVGFGSTVLVISLIQAIVKLASGGGGEKHCEIN